MVAIIGMDRKPHATAPMRDVDGFTRRTLTSLCRAGLATAQGKTGEAGDSKIAVGHVRITDAGRTALEG
jgi:hypothetical protein